jgi:hypothetical protein
MSVSVGAAAAHQEVPSVRFFDFPTPRLLPDSPPQAARFSSSGPAIQPPWPARTASLRATLEHSEISELQFSQFSGGATVERIPGFGSGSVREIFGHGFYNRLIVFGFTNVIAQIRGKISEIDFGYVSGETPIEKCRRANSLRFLNLKGRRRAVPCIFSPLLYRLSYLGLECGSAY